MGIGRRVEWEESGGENRYRHGGAEQEEGLEADGSGLRE